MKEGIDYKNLAIPEIQFVKIGEDKIAYRTYGKGQPLLLLPSWPANSIEYIPLMNLLKDSFQTFAIDLPGLTGYSKSPKNNCTIEDYLEIIEEFRRKVVGSETHLLGYSFGVLLATLLKSRNHSSYKKVVLVSGFADGRFINRRFPKLIVTYKYIKLFLPEVLVSKVVQKLLFNVSRRG